MGVAKMACTTCTVWQAAQLLTQCLGPPSNAPRLSVGAAIGQGRRDPTTRSGLRYGITVIEIDDPEQLLVVSDSPVTASTQAP